MSTEAKLNNIPHEKRGGTISGWRLVALREMTDLWAGGRAIILVILFSILLGIMSYLLATNNELRLLPSREMAYMIIQATIVVGLFIGILIGADTISGERERKTLEGLLLTPTSRRQIVMGKFLAAVSTWPAILLISAVHLFILAPNLVIFEQSAVLMSVVGSLLVIGFTGFGMLVSTWSNSNRTSIFTSLFVAILFLLPTQFPGTAQTGFIGKLVKRINPMEAVNQFVEKVLVNNRTVEEMESWLLSPLLVAFVILIVLFLFVAPRLDFSGEKSRLKLPGRAVKTAALILVMMSFSIMAIPTTHAQDESLLQISIDTDYQHAKTGDTFDFITVVTSNYTEESPAIVVAMNIVNLGDGDPVDPEDWSPERTQTIDSLQPGESAELTWTINAILEGDYLAYLVVIPEPDAADATSLPVSSPGIHLTVEQFTNINPGGVTPIALGMPIGLTLLLFLTQWYRRKRIDTEIVEA